MDQRLSSGTAELSRLAVRWTADLSTRDHGPPLDVVLRLLHDQPDAFKDVRDVVDASLLHAEEFDGVIQVEDLTANT